MCQAALQYVRRGWAVFPCRERDETVTIGGEERLFKAKAPYVRKGLKDATLDEAQVCAWWRRWPNAMIGVPTGSNGAFVVDFDPRIDDIVDEETGEIIGQHEWTLEQMKADLEALIGVPFPPSLTSRTISGGVHVWLKMPDDGGAEIRNSVGGKALTDHIDVRGVGGYVIAPPSYCEGGQDAAEGHYRWIERRGDWRSDDAISAAPAELIAVLRDKVRRKPAERAPAAPRSAPRTPSGAQVDQLIDEDVRKYARAAVEGECRAIGEAGSGRRNAQLNESAFKVATLVAAGAVDGNFARAAVEAAARANPGRDDDGQIIATIESGWSAGLEQPRDLAEIAAASRSRRERPRREAPPAARRAPAAREAANDASFRGGRVECVQALKVEEAARLRSVAGAWLTRRLAGVAREKDALTKLAYSVGRRVAAGLFEADTVRSSLWEIGETVADVQPGDLDRALGDGIDRGFDVDPLLVTMRCIGHPMTDFGIAERFRDRYGHLYRFTFAKGWLGWDTRRWKVLDQDEKTLPAEVIAAVFDTVRLIQDEARFMADTGVRVIADADELDLPQENPHGMDRMVAKGKNLVTLSSIMAEFGRKSETVGKPASVAQLARRWLTVPIERFDHDPLAFNVMNGTLRFRVEEMPDGSKRGAVELMPHDREAMLTKLSPVTYDPAAASPRYDKMFGWAQPDEAMRRYLHQLGGYALTGDAGEQKLWFWYGRGRNGKGTTLDVWQHVVGDYADTIPIGSFLDQGIKKRGDQASPDLAKLAGVRMLRSSEPGRNEKLDSGLIKLVTGGDPVPVRMLHRGFFNLQPLFKLIIMGNTRFDIPDTDDGIWSRMKLIPWLRNIEKPEPGVADWPEKDPKLPAKIIEHEASGVLNRLVGGLLDYLTHGLVEPQSVTQATSDYRDASDPLARFLRLCVETDADSRVQSSRLHEVFVAWCTAAGERPWSNKGFSNAMAEKGYQKKQSDGMQWLGIRLIREVHDFVDADGKAKVMSDAVAPPDAARDPPPGYADDMPL